MNYKMITNPEEISRESWNQFLYAHPDANFFQTPIAYDFFKMVEGYQPISLFAMSQNDILGLLIGAIVHEKHSIKGYYSRRCIVSGGPLALGPKSEEIISNILNELTKVLSKEVIYIEFRNLHNMGVYKDIFSKSGYNYEEYLNFILKITSLEANMKLIKRQKRQQINTALKLGAEIIEPANIGQVEEFYSILKNYYRNKVKKPLPPFSFFKEFYNSKESGKYFFIKYNGKIINGVMAPIFRNTIYNWYGNISTSEHRELYSGTLSTWSTIEYACRNGLKYVDFLGAGKPDEDYGVREFKATFGGDLVNYGRFKKINNTIIYNIGKIGLKVFGKLSV